MNEKILDILKKEVGPALGCTSPVCVAFVGALARDAVKGTPNKIDLILDKDTYKNTMRVYTPGTPYMGVNFPTILGAFYGDPSLGMEVLNTVKGYDPKFIEDFEENHFTTRIMWKYKGMGVYLEAYVYTENGVGHAIVAKSHVNPVLIEANGKIIYKDESFRIDNITYETKDPIRAFNIRNFYDFAKNVDYENISFLEKAIDINIALSLAGIDEKAGGKFGIGIGKLNGDSMYLKAKMYAAAASDARMSGVNLPAMACATSGNVGITASIPLAPVAEKYGRSKEQLVRAVALSYLMTIYIKSHIGRLSAMCACAIAAGVGIAAGSSFLISDSYDKIEMAIKNIIGSLGGVLCDGAKFGCALKLSTAAGIGIESALLADQGIGIPSWDGLVCGTADETIEVLGKVAKEGMHHTAEVLAKIFVAREGIETD